MERIGVTYSRVGGASGAAHMALFTRGAMDREL
jgi:hypothetical protein